MYKMFVPLCMYNWIRGEMDVQYKFISGARLNPRIENVDSSKFRIRPASMLNYRHYALRNDEHAGFDCHFT